MGQALPCVSATLSAGLAIREPTSATIQGMIRLFILAPFCLEASWPMPPSTTPRRSLRAWRSMCPQAVPQQNRPLAELRCRRQTPRELTPPSAATTGIPASTDTGCSSASCASSDAPFTAEARRALAQSLTPVNIAQEVKYLEEKAADPSSAPTASPGSCNSPRSFVSSTTEASQWYAALQPLESRHHPHRLLDAEDGPPHPRRRLATLPSPSA